MGSIREMGGLRKLKAAWLTAKAADKGKRKGGLCRGEIRGRKLEENLGAFLTFGRAK